MYFQVRLALGLAQVRFIALVQAVGSRFHVKPRCLGASEGAMSATEQAWGYSRQLQNRISMNSHARPERALAQIRFIALEPGFGGS